MPAAVPVIAGYAAAKGGIGSPLTNTQEVRKPEMDQNGFQYGGQVGGADAASQRVQHMGREVGNERGSQNYNFDRNLSLQDRNAQVRGIGYANEGLNAYRQAMNGQVPSVAQMQMRQGLQNAQAAAASTAASARGGGANLAAAQRMAAQQQGQLAGQSNEQAAMLRANEMAQARQGFLGASQNYQGVANSLRASDQAQGNMSMQNALGRAQLQQGYEGQGQNIQAQQLNAQMAYQQANANNDLRAQEGMAKIGSENTQGTRQLIAGIVGGGSQVAGSLGNTGSDEKLKTDIKPADEGKIFGVNSSGQAGQARSLDTENPYASMKIPSMGDKASKANPMKAMMSMGDGIKSMGAPINTDYSNPYGQGEVIGLQDRTASDERLKGDVRSGPPIESTLNALHPKSYEYKQPEVDGYGQRAGIMAQDLAKTPLGRQVIEETPRGMYLDNNKALSLSLAANANLNERLNKIEGAFRVDPRAAYEKEMELRPQRAIDEANPYEPRPAPPGEWEEDDPGYSEVARAGGRSRGLNARRRA